MLERRLMAPKECDATILVMPQRNDCVARLLQCNGVFDISNASDSKKLHTQIRRGSVSLHVHLCSDGKLDVRVGCVDQETLRK